MIGDVQVHGLGLTDLLIVAGILAYLVDRFVDARGWSRSSKTLRRENEDLVRRNKELEETLSRHETLIADLKAEVTALKRSDQTAVLNALKEHEAGAKERHTSTVGLLTRAVEALEGGNV